MSEQSRIAELERAMRLCWGALLLADLVVDDPQVKAAFRKADDLCRRTGLLPREGMAFVYSETN